ncbi:MAG: phage portal protein [Ruminococcus sp.]|nr:phage portal protein [Ruminococcus sp.]MCM1380357.1 phage portal protein [Muribaculaceae bacterium]MCM1478333.1 phage portal protein [Muribaculaceae bacterium]
MKLFGKKEKRAETAEVTVTYDGDFFAALVGTGDTITRQKALEIPAVQFCVELFSGLVAALPVKLYEEYGDGKVTEIKNDVRVRLLNGDTGDTVNGTMFRRLWVHDYFLGGGAYAYIERDIYGMPCGLYYVDESRLTVIPNGKAIFKDYSVSVDGAVYPKSDFLKILRNSKGNGRGAGIASESGTMLATAYNTMLYENSVVKKGGNKKGFFTSQNQQTQSAMQSIKEAWRKMNSSGKGVEDNVAVLNAGMDFKEVSLSSMDMQLNQNKQTNSGEICGLFGVPPVMMSGSASAEAKENFITDALTPLLNTFEAAFDSDLLLESEKGRRYFAFDTRELTRGDILKRYQAYAIGKKNGFVQIDDIRRLEDMPPINFPYISLGLADVLYNPETGEIYTPNTDTVINIRDMGRKIGEGESDVPEQVSDNSAELRFNPNHDPKSGEFASAGEIPGKG